jgi:hypothetical protein
MLASHNTFSYAGVPWWAHLFNIWARCQNNPVKVQYERGVRHFDIRFRPNSPYIRHGIVPYRITVEAALSWLNKYAVQYPNEPIYIRFLIEYNFKPRHKYEIISQAVQKLNRWRELYPNIKGADCYMKYNMEVINTNWPSTNIELHGDYVHFPTIKHFPWIPRIYARRNNFRIIQENADIIKSKTKAMAIDFV